MKHIKRLGSWHYMRMLTRSCFSSTFCPSIVLSSFVDPCYPLASWRRSTLPRPNRHFEITNDKAVEDLLAAAGKLDAIQFTPNGPAGIFALYTQPGANLGFVLANEFFCVSSPTPNFILLSTRTTSGLPSPFPFVAERESQISLPWSPEESYLECHYMGAWSSDRTSNSIS